MRITRRQWLAAAIGSACAALAQGPSTPQQRISRIIREYEQQGFHRTGTQIDQLSGDWLCREVGRAGLRAIPESFPLSRVDPVRNILTVDERSIEGLPLFDGAFTGAEGVRGRFGMLGSAAEIGLAETAPSGPTPVLEDARRANRHRAIVAITRGARPGLCPRNADSFEQPYGPPVLQVSSEHGAWLTTQAQRGAEVHLIAHVARTSASAMNVTATIKGLDPALPPLVVMTPRSGWYACASERGGGIVCWLEIMRALSRTRPARSVVFVASSGHELGHLGINAFVERRPNIVRDSVGWIHLAGC